MPLDTQIALGIQPIQLADPMAQYSHFAQARAAGNQNALAQYQLEAAQRADVTANALNEAYKRHLNPDTGEINYAGVRNYLAQQGAGSQIPAMEKQRMDIANQALQQQKLTNEVGTTGFDLKLKKANKAIADITSLNNPEEAIASIDTHVKNGDIDPDKAAQLKATLTAAPSFGDWQKSMLLNILDAKQKLTETAPKPTELRLGNVVKMIDTNPNSPTFKQEIVPQQTIGLTAQQEMEKTTPKPTQIRLGDTVKTIDMNPNSPTYKQEVLPPQAIGMTANEKAMLPIHQAQLKVAQDRLNAEMATGNVTPATVDFIAETYRQTGTLPPLGMGPMAATLRSKIMERAAQLSMGGDKTAAEAVADVRGNKAENAGLVAGSRAVGTQIANVQVAANEANKMIGVARPYVDKVQPTDYPVLNAAGNFIAKNTGDPNIVGLATSLNAIVNTYARAINPKGVATVSDKNHAREILNAAMSKGQLNEAFSVMEQEMGAALASGPETKAAMRPGAAPAGGKVVDFGSLK